MIYNHRLGMMCLSKLYTLFEDINDTLTLIPKKLDFTNANVAHPICIHPDMFKLLASNIVTLHSHDVDNQDTALPNRINIKGWWYKKQWFDVVPLNNKGTPLKILKDFR